jgi:hypothetical protein
MRLEDARRLLGKNVALNANGGSIFVGRLNGVCEAPSVLVVDDSGTTHSLSIEAIDGWVVEGVPPRLGGEVVAGS